MSTLTTATDDTATRFGLLEIGDAPVAAQTPVTVAPAAPPVKIIPGVTVDQDNVRRALRDQEAAQKAGFSLPPPVYQLGQSVNETGRANFRKSRQDFDAGQSVPEACNALIAQVRAEERVDVLAEAPSLFMLPDGRLQTLGNGAYPMSRRAIEGLAQFLTPGGGSYLAECPADLRADNFNRWFPLGFREDARATKKAGPKADTLYAPKKVTIRTRKDEGAWSVVGPRYGAFDIDKVAAEIADSVGGDAKCDVTYDGYKARFDILFHTNVAPERAVAGEIFKAGLVIRTADDGSGAINISMVAHRNLCLNLIILAFDKVLVGSRRHMGSERSIRESVQAHMAMAQEGIGHFVRAWDNNAAENVLERYNLQDVDQVIDGLVLNKVVHVSGVHPDEMKARLRRAWDMEPGYNRTSFLNAITRAAHENPWEHHTDVDDMEETAGRLMFQKNWSLDLPKSKTVAEALAF